MPLAFVGSFVKGDISMVILFDRCKMIKRQSKRVKRFFGHNNFWRFLVAFADKILIFLGGNFHVGKLQFRSLPSQSVKQVILNEIDALFLQVNQNVTPYCHWIYGFCTSYRPGPSMSFRNNVNNQFYPTHLPVLFMAGE